MRLFIYLFVAALALPAQVVLVPGTSPNFLLPWSRLQEYLTLSEGQIDAMSDASQSYWDLFEQLEQRRTELKGEILAETNRSPLRLAELGQAHAEWEAIRRRHVTAERERNAATRAVLSEAQLIKLRALDELAARREVMENATSIGLSPTDCEDQRPVNRHPICEAPYVPAIAEIPTWGVRPEDGSSRIAQFLDLTNTQIHEPQDVRQRLYSGDEFSRMQDVWSEIRIETGRKVLDSLALGLRYAEIESLRRKHFERERRATEESEALLTAAQRVKLETLKEVIRLRPTVEEARTTNLLARRCVETFYFFRHSWPASETRPLPCLLRRLPG